MIKNLLKDFFRKIGLDVKWYSVASHPSARLCKILETNGINIVFDIGANIGQFGTDLRKSGYKGQIVSFEPLLEPYNVLCQAVKHDSLWKVAPRLALGEENGEIEINIAGNSASSSILEMLDTHIKAAPITATIGKEKVPIKKLDFLAPNYLNKNSNLFIKIDTQGYEDNVLNGGINAVKSAKVLQLELSIVELYAGQKLIFEMIDKIKQMGFELWGIESGFVDSNTGQMLQVDAIFINNNVTVY